MRKPVIAITPQYNMDSHQVKVEESYLKAIHESGGIGIVLSLYQNSPDYKQIVELADGFIYSGGPDMNPFYFNEEAIPECRMVMKERDRFEYEMLPYILKSQKPVLGICRGIQVLNISLGGDIYQDIEAQYENPVRICHYQKAPGTTKIHHVAIAKDTLLYRILQKDSIAVNSYHHQAVRKLADGLVRAAVSKDGLTEAVTMEQYPFFLAIQWHPEELFQEDEDSQKIFAAFVAACKEG